MLHNNRAINQIMNTSKYRRWITTREWDLIFLNEDLFQIINHILIPIETVVVRRVDNEWMSDNKEWIMHV